MVVTGLIQCQSLVHLIPKYKDEKVVNLVPLQITIQTGEKLMSVHTNVYKDNDKSQKLDNLRDIYSNDNDTD